MAGNELNVQTKNEIKRLWELGLKKRAIAHTTGIHRNTVSKYINELISEKLDKNNLITTAFATGVSLNVIHEELLENNKLTVQYSGFWKQAQKKISLATATMVKIHKPGERAEIDYADGIEILDPAGGPLWCGGVARACAHTNG